VLDPWSLRILVAVADHGSFSGAADELILTQPAVSRQIAGLERRFGVPLFRRAARGVTLTTAGSTAVQLAREVLAHTDAFEATMKALSGLDRGHLRVGGFASANTHFLPAAVHRFGHEHPGITVSLHQVDPLMALHPVREGRLDLVLVTEWQLVEDPITARTRADAPRLDVDRIAGVELVPLLDEELRIALPSSHRLSRRRRVPLAELRDERWVDGAHPDCLGPLPQLTAALGCPPKIGFMCDDWNGKQALVAGGAGIMVVPTLAGPSIRADLVVRRTTPTLPVRRLYAATARPPFRTAPADAMLALLAELASELVRAGTSHSRIGTEG
jgi:DNA-binding transcriptional LysR family regulator